MSHKSDWEWLPDYHEGEDKPVGIWITRHYEYLSFKGYQQYPISATVEDAIQDVAQKMLSDNKEQRRQRFKPVKKNIKGAIWVRLKSQLIDLYRVEKRKKTISISQQHDIPDQEKEDPLENLFVSQEELLMKAKNELSADEQKFLELMLLHGFGKLKPITSELGISIEEGRVTKQRITRKIKRFILNNQK